MRRILALLILLAIPAVAQFGGPMGGMRPGSMQGGGLLPGRGGDPLWVAAGPTKPTLDFDFAKRKDLTDAVSGKTSLVNFSRSAAQSPGTYVGSDGLIHDAAVNLALYSEQFDNAAWSKEAGVTVTANQAIAPDGKQTADKVSSTTERGLWQTKVLGAGTYTFSVYLKATASTTGLIGRIYPGDMQSIDITTEWQRFHFTFTLSGSTTIYPQIRQSSDFGVVDVFIWGAQLQETDAATMAPTAYIHTTSQALAAPRFDHTPTTGNLTTNLITYSEMLENAAWYYDASSAFVTRTENQAAAPDGTSTADKIVLSSGRRADNAYIGNPRAPSPISTAPFTASIYLKDAGNRYGVITVGSFASGYYAIFDLQAGTVTTAPTASGVTASIIDAGDGWYRCAVIADASVGSASIEALVLTSSPDNTLTTTHNGTDGIYAWGGQLQTGTTPGPYVRTLSETRSISDANAESLGLLVEEARANLVTNSEEIETSFSGRDGGSFTGGVDVATAPDGTSTAELFTEDNTVGRHYVYRSAGYGAGTYAFSVFVKQGAGSRVLNLSASFGSSNYFSVRYDLSSQTVSAPIASGTFSGVSGTLEDYGNGWFRATAILTSSGSFYLQVGASTSNTATISFYGLEDYTGDNASGLYLWGAQLETGSFPTSYIPTVTSQTRYADIAAVQDEDFSTTNLISYSESFDVGWSATRLGARTPNATIAPDGTLTAEYIGQQGGQTLAGGVYQSHTLTGNQTISVYAKAGEKNFLRIADVGGQAWFDLQNGAVGTATGGAASISDVGNGWYRCSFQTTTASTTNIVFYLGDTDNSTTVTDSGGIYLWGASLTATEYPVDYVTTRNLLTDSQDFERATWVKGNTTIDDDAVQAPDGTLTADKLKETTATGQFQATQNVNKTGQFVASAYFKAAERSKAYIQNTLSVGGIYVVFDLSNETASAFTYGGAALPTASITNLGNGWYRCVMSMSASATVVTSRFSIANDAGGTSYTGIDGYGVYLWGAQLEPGTTATDYVRTVDTVGKAYGFYEPTEGTVFVEADKISDYPNSAVGSFESDANNVIAFGHRVGATSANTASVWIRNAGSTEFFRSQSNSYDGWKMSLAFKYNNGNMATDGTIFGAADTAMTLPVVSRLQIGKYATVTSTLNGHIRRLTYWPRRQSDSTLQVITQ